MIDIVYRIKAASEGLGWKFAYGLPAIRNLMQPDAAAELTVSEVHFWMKDPERRPVTNTYGGVESVRYNLEFFILTPSRYDQDIDDLPTEYYFQKFDHKIAPILNLYYAFSQRLVCPGVVLNVSSITEVYNTATENFDGIYVKATCEVDNDGTIGSGVLPPPLPTPTELCQLITECSTIQEILATLSNHEDRITALEEGGGGGQPFDCSDLEQCGNFTEVRDTANSALAGLAAKADSASLATVATTGAYSDLSGLPVIPTVPTQVSAFTNDAGYITSAGLITLQPLVTYYDLAGHTGDTNATIVLSFQVNANQWLANGRYAINVETQKTGTGAADFTIYLNTSATIGGIPVAAFNSTQNAHRWIRSFTVKPGFIRYTTGLPAQTTDWQNGSFANAQTTEAALNRNQTLFFVCVIQNAAAGVNSSFLTINIRAV